MDTKFTKQSSVYYTIIKSERSINQLARDMANFSETFTVNCAITYIFYFKFAMIAITTVLEIKRFIKHSIYEFAILHFID